MSEILEKFYAVTKNSLYMVISKNESGQPFAEKIAQKKEGKIEISEKISGPMLAIAKNLQFYIPEAHSMLSSQTGEERRLEIVNTMWWRAGTSKIVALFLTKEDALVCFNQTDLMPCDARWLDKTKEVLDKIGEDHPTISICHYHELELLSA
ncbi:hypothetical protein JW977_02705 [Candidatus Falkowbacteria bacterium]|nr:hypothetical protein [Candidatus Falkowbacteria bacterium]